MNHAEGHECCLCRYLGAEDDSPEWIPACYAPCPEHETLELLRRIMDRDTVLGADDDVDDNYDEEGVPL